MRSKIQVLFIVLALLLASVHSALAQVTNLGIASAGGQSVIYWPTSTTTNYVLQTTANPAAPNWLPATNAVVVNAVTVTNSAPAGYFRLLQSTNPPGMALIPAGSFTIGNYLVNNFYNPPSNDPDISDAIPTNVYVSAFYMEINLVTGDLWTSVYSYATGHGYTFVDVGSAKAGNNPVLMVDWYDCVKWCNARSQQAGLTPVYYLDAGFTRVYTNGEIDAVYPNWKAGGYRLPTESEWEKAARGGLTGNRFPWGNFISESQADYYGSTSYSYNDGFDLGPDGYNANFDSSSPYTSPVGSFAPNGYGLYDMAGNVFEWCWDWYAPPPYPAGSAYLGGTNPMGPAGPFGSRVTRGGGWTSYAFNARCAFRRDFPGSTYGAIGFRCVRGF